MDHDYWQHRSCVDTTYAQIQHQQSMDSLVMETEYKLFQMLKPSIQRDGNQWCVLYGENLQEGIAGFGDSPYLAVLDFNKAWNTSLSKSTP